MEIACSVKWAPSTQILKTIEEILNDEGIGFTKENPDRKRGVKDHQWTEVYLLEIGFRIRVEIYGRALNISIGPVTDDNKEEIDRLRSILEKEL